MKFNTDRYPQGNTYGLRNNRNLILGPDVSWQPLPSVSAHACYTYEQIFLRSEQPVSDWWLQRSADRECGTDVRREFRLAGYPDTLSSGLTTICPTATRRTR